MVRGDAEPSAETGGQTLSLRIKLCLLLPHAESALVKDQPSFCMQRLFGTTYQPRAAITKDKLVA